MEYYNIEKIKSKGADHNFIFSGRGPGKSYQICKHILRQYIEKGTQSVRVVRNISYLGNIANWFDPGLLGELREKHGLEVKYGDSPEGERSCYMVYPVGEPKKAQVFCYVVVLSQEHRKKSDSGKYANVYDIVTEEFALLDPFQYEENEREKYLSLISTIIRHREGVRCWYIGNTITKVCPYFDLFHIDIDRMGLKSGELRPVSLPTDEFKHPATVWVEFAKMPYGIEDEIPRALRIPGNISATTGEFVRSPDVFDYDPAVCTAKKLAVTFRCNDFDIKAYHLKGTNNIVYFYRCPKREKNTVPIEFPNLSAKVAYQGKDYRRYFSEWREFNAEYLYSDDGIKRLIQKADKTSAGYYRNK